MRLRKRVGNTVRRGTGGVFCYVMTTALAGVAVVALPGPQAHADGVVRYEVISNFIGSADVDFTDGSGRTTLAGVTLPWRANVAVRNPYSVDTTLRVTWQGAQRYKWVKIRIYTRGSLLCEGTFDVGDGACTARGLYGGQIPLFLPPTSPAGAPG